MFFVASESPAVTGDQTKTFGSNQDKEFYACTF